MSKHQCSCGMEDKKTSGPTTAGINEKETPQPNHDINKSIPAPITTTTTTITTIVPPQATQPTGTTPNPTIAEHHGYGGNWLCCVPCYWLRRNNSVHKASLTVATLLVTSLLVASPVLFLISAVPASDVPPRDCRFLPAGEEGCVYVMEGSAAAAAAMLGPECSEPQCIASVARVASALDRRVDPCSDFQKYSCGRWRANGGGHSLTDMQNGVHLHLQQLLANATSGGFRKLGEFYRSCIQINKKPISMTPTISESST